LPSIGFYACCVSLKNDEQLKENSQTMVVKRKDINVIDKYEFGSYKVISG
jgi:hypothetical protein